MNQPAPLAENAHYRPDIDGLRAVAIGCVVLFHAGVGCTGGYVGVDVFFVISGFLITSLLWRELEGGTFSFVDFWARRARRIVPALVVVVLATVVAGWFLLVPVDYVALGRATAAQAVFAGNFQHWQVGGYFDPDMSELPLLHTWSLAVEEQFYLLAPVLLWGAFCMAGARRRAWAIGLIGAGLLASFAVAVLWSRHHMAAAFYLPPTRAWELLLGALLVFLPAGIRASTGRLWRELAALAGALLILVPAVVYTDGTQPFPGLGALPPCVGAALIIVSGDRVNAGPATWVARVLALRPIVFVGLLSYSIYLWHWPALAFAKYWSLDGLSPARRVVFLAGGLVLAFLSWRYVETPFRRRRWCASRASMLGAAAAGLAVVLACGVVCMAARGFPKRHVSPTSIVVQSWFEPHERFTRELTIADVDEGRLIRLGSTDAERPVSVLVWGDSHAMSALPAIEAVLNEKGLAGVAATHGGMVPVLRWFPDVNAGLRDDSPRYSQAVVDYVRKHRIPVVVLIARWRYYAFGHALFDRQAFNAALLETVQQLVASGARPVLVLDAPVHDFNSARYLSRFAYSRTYIEPRSARPGSIYDEDLLAPGALAAIRQAGCLVINPKPRFVDASGELYAIEARGVALYSDEHHLSREGARLMLVPFFREELPLPRLQK